MTNSRPIGSRRIERGYVLVKIADNQRGWRREHHVVWEAIHGPLPDGWCIHHIDGNKANNAPENLQACSSNSDHFRDHHDELLKENGRKVGKWNKGKPKSAEHRAKIAAANRGKPKSPEHRAKLAEATKKAWERGELGTEEIRQQQSEATRLSWQDAEIRERRTAATLARPRNPDGTFG